MRVRELALLLKAATLSGDRSCASPEQHSRVGLVVGGVREGDLTQLLMGCITLGRMGPAPLLGSTVELAWLVWVLMSRPRAILGSGELIPSPCQWRHWVAEPK